ncbi:ras-associated and pleckstrin homology domains-containing protein 1 [Rhodamnia argentea]|uniref:Ras-associated and pleckstrin homology domains-containing protein 1 n=1 Tax=Rhodamnia argentea TaxID=178133 RepID=A0A8B8QV80_9MYRT|nr:ras-associated and pleckstrin homology domains-containing protein 1 [Rhodamnia argentea]
MLHLQLPSHHPHFLSPHLFPLSPLHSTLSLSPFPPPPPPPPLSASASASTSALPRRRPRPHPCLAQASEPTAAEEPPEGPIELPPSAPSIFASTDDPTPLQVATSVLLTGAISVFLFRSVRRRAKRAKELKFRSSGAKKTLKEEALDSLKAMGTTSIPAKAPPSPVQALLGGIAAGVIALILYKFTTTIEAALNRQTLSDNFSVRQISITIRTIVNGLCYLATFAFGINSIGLFLYSGQLAINSFTEGSSSRQINESDGQLTSPESLMDTPKTNDSQDNDKTDSTQ